jgi:hypothetical protein
LALFFLPFVFSHFLPLLIIITENRNFLTLLGFALAKY